MFVCELAVLLPPPGDSIAPYLRSNNVRPKLVPGRGGCGSRGRGAGWHTNKAADVLAIFLRRERLGREQSPGAHSPNLGHFPLVTALRGAKKKKKRGEEARRQGTRLMKTELGKRLPRARPADCGLLLLALSSDSWK